MSAQAENGNYKLLKSYSSNTSNSTSDISNASVASDVVEFDILETTTMQQKTEPRQTLLTRAIQSSTVLFAIFILYLSLLNGIELFTWHPILLSVAWACLMIEAILTISGDNFFTKYIPPRNRVLIHWTLQSVATVLTLTGFAIVYINKNIKNKEHFKSWHGVLGLTTIICLLPTCAMGVVSLYKVDLRKIIGPAVTKSIHICCGTATFILGTLTVILGLYSHWFTRYANYSAQVICSIVVVVGTAWILLKPIQFLLRKI